VTHSSLVIAGALIASLAGRAAAAEPATAGEPRTVTATDVTPAAPAAAAEPGELEKKAAGITVDKSIEWHRAQFEALSERMIGVASKPVRFDWRKASLGINAMSSILAELNNYQSWRAGGGLRFMLSSVIFDLEVSKTFTRSTDSSQKLARTPYRQYGRPGRIELDLGLSLPLAEGVVTAWPGFFPATELVLSASAGFRYLYYPGALAGAGFLRAARAVMSPSLTGRERRYLDLHRNAGMQVDEGRYGLLVGLTTDIYFHSGFYVSPRVLCAVPLLATMTRTQLRYWWELTLGAGYAF
jgi:hypothetical protein